MYCRGWKTILTEQHYGILYSTSPLGLVGMVWMTDLILYVDWVCLFGLVDLASLVVRNKKPRRWLRKDTFREALSKYLLFTFWDGRR